jgi:hypothetical protein
LFDLFAEALHWILECCIASVDGLSSTKLSHYLDDLKFIGRDRAMVEALSQVYIYTTDFLGVPRKSEKDDCGTSVIILGYLADTVTMRLSIPDEKRRFIISDIKRFIHATRPRLRQSRSLAGRLSYASFVVRLGRSYIRSLYDFTRRCPEESRQSRPSPPQEVYDDLRWWLQAMPVHPV